MTKTLEIVPVASAAVVETYVGGRRTGTSAVVPVREARAWGERAKAEGTRVVDHTHGGRGREEARAKAMERFRSGDFRP